MIQRMINMNQYICSKIYFLFVWRNSNSLQTVLVIEFSFGITGIFKMNFKIFKNLCEEYFIQGITKNRKCEECPTEVELTIKN